MSIRSSTVPCLHRLVRIRPVRESGCVWIRIRLVGPRLGRFEAQLMTQPGRGTLLSVSIPDRRLDLDRARDHVPFRPAARSGVESSVDPTELGLDVRDDGALTADRGQLAGRSVPGDGPHVTGELVDMTPRCRPSSPSRGCRQTRHGRGTDRGSQSILSLDISHPELSLAPLPHRGRLSHRTASIDRNAGEMVPHGSGMGGDSRGTGPDAA